MRIFMVVLFKHKITVILSRRIKQTRHDACVGEMVKHTKLYSNSFKVRNLMGDPGVEKRIILRLM
jgi:hypothetical protein